MTNIRRRIASLPPVKALRVKKWERNAARYLLSPRLCAAAEQDTSLRHRLIRDRLARFAAPRETAAAAQALGLPPETAEDVLWWQISRGYSLNEYLCYGFAEKTPCERRAFISDRESVLLSYRLNDLDAMAVFSDKARTFAAFGARYGRDVIAPETADDYGAFLRFLRKRDRKDRRRLRKRQPGAV